MIRTKSNLKNWQQINYRQVNNLLSAEFLHDLYNRHDPIINSIRFRNTLIIKKGNKVKSYAPKIEWEMLIMWMSERFLRNESEIFDGVNALISYDRARLRNFLSKLDALDLESVDQIGLALLIMDMYYLPLGEIYKVNLVQIEKSLNCAIIKLLMGEGLTAVEANEALSSLIFSEVETFGTGYNRRLIEMIIANKKAGLDYTDPSNLSFYNENKYKFSAYGADIESLEDSTDRFKKMYLKSISELESELISMRTLYEKSIENRDEMLSRFSKNELLIKCVGLMKRLGTRRDQNKEYMGTTNFYKEKLLDRISVVSKVNRGDINNYLLNEICELLRNGKKVEHKIIMNRKKIVTFHREEYIDNKEYRYLNSSANKKLLTGVCASKGKVKGVVKIIKGGEDVDKMEAGDIMVAPGTDFDVINAMQIAAAIVTEEGGVLSHASVICRELGIPCLISVRNATVILHDGDIVEVDATNGIITKYVEEN